jgi:hypothetical protein
MTAKRTPKRTARSTDARVAQLADAMAKAPLIQVVHDLSLLLGAKCSHCEDGTQHRAYPDKPKKGT